MTNQLELKGNADLLKMYIEQGEVEKAQMVNNRITKLLGENKEMKNNGASVDEFLKWCNGEIEIEENPCTIVHGNWGDYITHSDGSTSYYGFTDTH